MKRVAMRSFLGVGCSLSRWGFVGMVCLMLTTVLLFCDVTLGEGDISPGTGLKFAYSTKAEYRPVPQEEIHSYQAGFIISDGEPGVFLCRNASADEHRGLLWTAILNQTTPDSMIVRLSSAAEEVDGNCDSNYSLYIDVQYTDGSHDWGQYRSFTTGTHDWEEQELILIPKRPIQALHIYGLFRGHTGTVRFRDLMLATAPYDKRITVFNGDAVRSGPVPSVTRYFQLKRIEAEAEAKGTEPESSGPRSIYLGSPESNENSWSNEGLSIDWSVQQESDWTRYELVLESRTDKDQVLTCYYTIRLSAESLQWLADPRTAMTVQRGEEYAVDQEVSRGKLIRRLSRYPFAAVVPNGQTQGTALALDPFLPVFYRIFYNADTEEFCLALDVALTKEKSRVTIPFLEFKFDAAQGFRGALARYYDLFPDAFLCRTQKQGNWMPFYAIRDVPGWQDFGFRFMEGDGNTGWDDEHDIITFRYTEPMTWWQPLSPDLPRTLEVAMNEATRMAGQGNALAQALPTSVFHDPNGNPVGIFLDTPWCTGVVWSLCDLPGITSNVPADNISGTATSSFSTKWNPELLERLYPGKLDPNRPNPAGPGLEGEYIDSSEGYVTAPWNYRREHFSITEAPLTFDEQGRAVIYRGLITWEYARKMAMDLHERGRLVMANSTPGQFFWLVPWLDVLGTETDWNQKGEWSPMSDTELLYRRALCGPKPFCFLMNSDFSRFGHAETEKYMKRAIAYGMFPGFFSADVSTGHYFSRSELYERDRDLFRKYMPIARRVAESHWQPLSGAVASDPEIRVERFGKPEFDCYWTILNDSDEEKSFDVRIDSGLLRVNEPIRELVSGQEVVMESGVFHGTLAPGGLAVLSQCNSLNNKEL